MYRYVHVCIFEFFKSKISIGQMYLYALSRRNDSMVCVK